MHCPRCGQQQVSDQTKFCSRCGFQLGLVSELLMNGGFLPQLAELYKGKTTIFTRKNGLIFTVLWFIFFMMMVPAFFGGVLEVEEIAAASAIFGLFSSMMLFIISLAFLKRPPKPYELAAHQMAPPPPSLYGNPAMGALPPQQTQPASTYMPPEGSWRAPDTDELTRRPGSVTEGTTRLLKKDE
jgi:hypothetical protein